MSAVLVKIAKNVQSKRSGSRRISDKVRVLCHRKTNIETLALPTESESLDVRVARMMSSYTEVLKSEQKLSEMMNMSTIKNRFKNEIRKARAKKY